MITPKAIFHETPLAIEYEIYSNGFDALTIRMANREDRLWSVLNVAGRTLSLKGEWHYTTQKANRTDKWYADNIFNCFEDARKAALEAADILHREYLSRIAHKKPEIEK